MRTAVLCSTLLASSGRKNCPMRGRRWQHLFMASAGSRIVWTTVGLGLLATAAIVALLAPRFNALSRDHQFSASLDTEATLSDTEGAAAVPAKIDAQRSDIVLGVNGDLVVIEAELKWLDAEGRPLFENVGIYGVDRRTRANVTGYGDAQRTGQFLLPAPVEKRSYELWDPMFIGPRRLEFSRTEVKDGLEVYVFEFTVTALDETVGYSHLSQVPERFAAHTDARGTVWAERASGTVVDYAESGVTYFFDPRKQQRLGDLQRWSQRYSETARREAVARARSERRRIHLFGRWIPGGLFLLGLAAVVIGRRRPPTEEPAR